MSSLPKPSKVADDIMDEFNDILMLKQYSKKDLETRMQTNQEQINVLKIKSLLNLPFEDELIVIRNQVSNRVSSPVIILSDKELKNNKISTLDSIPLSYGIYLVPISKIKSNSKPAEMFSNDQSVIKSRKVLRLIEEYIQEKILMLEEENSEIRLKLTHAA